MNKETIDRIFETLQAEPVGDGYIDVVVCPNTVLRFVSEIRDVGFVIEGTSWWEYCGTTISDAKFGAGGPKSLFYQGWFAEIPTTNIDRFEKSDSIDDILSKIRSRMFKGQDSQEIKYSDGLLWPGFWVTVPDSWKIDRARI